MEEITNRPAPRVFEPRTTSAPNIAVVQPGETWPEAGQLPLWLIEDDGEPASIYGTGGAEVVLISKKRGEGEGRLVIPLAFPTLNRARRAGAVLAAAFSEVRALQAEEAPDQERCEHPMVWEGLLSRMVEKHRICEVCGAHLGTIDMRRRTREDS